MHRERMTDCIETERLVLFPYTKESLALFNADLPAFEEAYGVTYRGEELDYLLIRFLHRLERELAADPEHYLFFTEFLIVLKENDHVVGSIDFKYVPRGGVTEVGYGLNPRYEGNGYMTEALRAFLDFGRRLGVQTVRADTAKENLRSQNVLKRCGFRFLREDGNLWWERELADHNERKGESSMKKKVVILESLGIPAQELAALEQPFAAEAEFVEYPRTTDVPALIEEAKDADAIILANMPLPGEVIAACGQLRFIDVAFTGVDHVGLEAARAKGIKVSNASGYSNEAVSELVVGMAISMLRSIPQVQERVRALGTKDGLVGCELRGKTVGIIGYGKIGSRTGELLHAFGCRILAQCRTRHDDLSDWVEQVSQDELLRRSDIVVLHCPLNDSTRGMIDYAKLSLMKRSAILINVARGPVTNEDDLARALREGVIAGAAIDVFTQEPPLAADTQLLHAPNTLLTPHVAFATKESMTLRAQIVFENLRAWLDGGQKNVIL